MDIGVISVRYARALLKSATDAKIEQQVYAEMQQIGIPPFDVIEVSTEKGVYHVELTADAF